MPAEPTEVTALLSRIAAGDPEGMDRLIPLVYGELRQLAAGQLRNERPDHTLSPTSLVHEAFLRLTGNAPTAWEGRSHFFGVAAQAMRRILVDHARRRTALKRGRQHQATLDEAVEAGAVASSEEVLGVDEALERLAALDPRQARVVELRYFVGLSIEETADVLGISPATVKRDWMVARAWLQRDLSSDS
jgi:RNA polymerase sigma factor (TIGR02999 family)